MRVQIQERANIIRTKSWLKKTQKRQASRLTKVVKNLFAKTTFSLLRLKSTFSWRRISVHWNIGNWRFCTRVDLEWWHFERRTHLVFSPALAYTWFSSPVLHQQEFQRVRVWFCPFFLAEYWRKINYVCILMLFAFLFLACGYWAEYWHLAVEYLTNVCHFPFEYWT